MTFCHCKFRLERDEHIGILVPIEHWIFTISRFRILHICPSSEEVLMAAHTGQFACDSPIDIFHHLEVRGEEDIKVALVNL